MEIYNVTQPEDGSPLKVSSRENKPHTFKPLQSQAEQTVSLLFFVIFWNGAISLFIIQAVNEFHGGRQDWIQVLFLVPFAGVGLLLILLFFHTLFGIGNPVPSIVLEPAKCSYGSSELLSWSWQGKAGRVQKLKIALTGRQVFYQKEGKIIDKEENEFFRMPLVETENPQEIVSGQVAFVMPNQDIPETGDIEWAIEIYGRVKIWSDVSEKLIIMSRREPMRSS
jgi:hypothetical protein